MGVDLVGRHNLLVPQCQTLMGSPGGRPVPQLFGSFSSWNWEESENSVFDPGFPDCFEGLYVKVGKEGVSFNGFLVWLLTLEY